MRLVLTLLGLLAAIILTLAAFRLPIGDSLRLLAEGAFGDRFAWGRTALKATPLLLTGLGMVVAWRAGIYNIGGEGQMVWGAVAAAALARPMLDTPALHNAGGSLILLVASAGGGAFWAGLAGWLYVRRGVEAVISTILLNFIAINALGWLCSGPLQERARVLPQTDLLPSGLMLFRWDRQMDFNAGSVIALIAAGAGWGYLYRSAGGYRLRLVGDSRSVARAYGIDAGAVQLRAMALSGGLCGLAGGIELLGSAGQLQASFPQNWGFLGIPVALVANLNPLGAIGSAIAFGALFAGSDNLGRFTSGGATLVYVVQAVAVLGLVVANSVRGRVDRSGDRSGNRPVEEN